MSFFRFFTLVIILLLTSACIKNTSQTESPNDLYNVNVHVSDSILIRHNRLLNFHQYNPTRKLLLFSDPETHSAVITNQSGKIVKSFSFGGKEKNKTGIKIGAIGWIDLHNIGIISERGLFFFSEDGKLLERIEKPSKHINVLDQQLFTYTQNDRSCLIYRGDPFYDPETEGFVLGFENEKYYNHFRLLTQLDLDDYTSKHIVGIEEESLFRRNPERTFQTMSAILAKQDNDLFVIFNPDPTLRIYDLAKQAKLKQTIPLELDHFAGEVDTKDFTKKLVTSSTIVGLLPNDDFFHSIYFSGVPDEFFPSMGLNMQEINELTSEHNQLYLSTHKKGEGKITNDIALPKNIANIVAKLDNETFIAAPHRGRVESPNYEKFYLIKISISKIE